MSKIRSNEAVRAQITEPNICSFCVTHTNKPYSTYIRLLFDRIQQLGFKNVTANTVRVATQEGPQFVYFVRTFRQFTGHLKMTRSKRERERGGHFSVTFMRALSYLL